MLCACLQKRKSLAGKDWKGNHHNWGGLLLGLGVLIAVVGPANTYIRLGKLFPGTDLDLRPCCPLTSVPVPWPCSDRVGLVCGLASVSTRSIVDMVTCKRSVPACPAHAVSLQAACPVLMCG